MRILWFSHFVPYPPKGGNFQRSFNLIREVSRTNDVHLIAFDIDRQPDCRLAVAAEKLKQYCDSVEFWKLALPWKSARWWTKMAVAPLMGTPYTCRSFWTPELDVIFRGALDKIRPDLVHFDSPDLALFTGAADGYHKLLNHHNCESVMIRRRSELESHPLKKAFLRDQARKLEKVEANYCSRFDVNAVVSGNDAESLRRHSPNAHFHLVENGTDTDFFAPVAAPEEPRTVIFAGSLNWYPNISAVRYLREKVWPLVTHGCGQARLYIAGMHPPDWVKDWGTNDGRVVVVDTPDDIRPWIARAAVFASPIWDGGGTRLKLLDAMAMGKAVVTTGFACDGLRVKDGRDLLVANSPEGFATTVLRLFYDEGIRCRMGRSARELVVQEYSWQRIGRELANAYACAVGGSTGECRQSVLPTAQT